MSEKYILISSQYGYDSDEISIRLNFYNMWDIFSNNMVEAKSLVVSDSLANAASKSAIEITGEGDVMYCDWEAYLHNTFEQNVAVFDFHLYNNTSKTRNGNAPKITEHKNKYKNTFENFAKTLRLRLKTGDSVVILNGPRRDVEIKSMMNQNEYSYSHKWMKDLGLFESVQYISERNPDIETNNDPVNEYLNTVSNHYVYNFNSGVIKQPEILATSPETGEPVAFVTSEIMNENGRRMETEGSLIILPQPSIVNKPIRLIELLVNLGWEFHDENRTDQIKQQNNDDSTTLSIPMGQLDDDLVEKCWSKYARGEYRDAAARAGQVLEHRVRSAVDDNNTRDGADLMKHAFSPENGFLAMGERPGEEEGVMHLYAGAIQGIWNPLHHRPSSNDSGKYLDEFGEQQAHDVISYINFLLNMLPEDE